MKIITDQQLSDVIKNILVEKEERAKKLPHSSMSIGIDGEELCDEVTKHIGDTWKITKEQPVKFTKADINAVAGARFFRKGGITLLMGLAIVILLLASGVRYSGMIMTPLLSTIYYSLNGIATIVFLWIYSKKQSKIRKDLWRQLGREESVEK